MYAKHQLAVETQLNLQLIIWECKHTIGTNGYMVWLIMLVDHMVTVLDSE